MKDLVPPSSANPFGLEWADKAPRLSIDELKKEIGEDIWGYYDSLFQKLRADKRTPKSFAHEYFGKNKEKKEADHDFIAVTSGIYGEEFDVKSEIIASDEFFERVMKDITIAYKMLDQMFLMVDMFGHNTPHPRNN